MFWLLVNIKFSRDTLKEYFNAPAVLTYTDNESIASMFSFIIPNLDNYKRYRFFELGIIFYLLSLFGVLISNIYDVFVKENPITGLTIFERPSFAEYFGFVFSSNLITITSIIITIILFIQFKKYLLDIRNLVLLLKWFNGSLKPAVIDSLMDKNQEFYEGIKPRYEYRRIDSTSQLHFCINLVHKSHQLSNSNLNDRPKFTTISGIIDLPKCLVRFNSRRKEFNLEEISLAEKIRIDPDLNRRLTEEELRMKKFFELLLKDKSYGDNLALEWNKV